MSKVRNLLGRIKEQSGKFVEDLALRPADKLKLGLSTAGFGMGAYSLHRSNQIDSGKADIDHQSLLALKKIHKALEEKPLVAIVPSSTH